ncbi:MAG: N-acetyl sugar amidotransferase [Bacteroidetes bacterium]|nr:N-acetyl sugar amidotransferase [Bacteroidota bacterium]
MITCTRCIMDSVNDRNLIVDDKGVCNHCYAYDKAIKNTPALNDGDKKSLEMVNLMKEEGKGKPYDCILGISGGVDSTYLAWLAKQKGLRVLLVHCDNGWNSELAVQNVHNICKFTGFDLETNVLDWEEFKDIQLAFFKAHVIDLELPYDYALMITIYKAALKYKINYVLTGHNVATEGTYLPKSWRHDKTDIVNIKDIHNKFGKLKMKTFPHFSFFKQLMVHKKLKTVAFLNYTFVSQKTMKDTIIRDFEWRDYGGKHFENIFTRFYQGYILPKKFNVNKRQFHFSILVQSKQITREQALKLYEEEYYSQELISSDKDFVLKKLNLSEEEFEKFINTKEVLHSNYDSISKYWDKYFNTIRRGKKLLLLKNK